MDLGYKTTARVFKAFCDENRLQILDLLRENELCAFQLQEALEIGQSTLSHHMKVLCGMGLTICRKEGIRCFYRLDTSNLRDLGRHFERLADYADQQQRGDPDSLTIPVPPTLLTGKAKNLSF